MQTQQNKANDSTEASQHSITAKNLLILWPPKKIANLEIII